MTTTVLVDLSHWKPDLDYESRVILCEELGLIETLKHGEHDYFRPTQKGINVLNTLMTLASHAADPENVLRQS